MSKAIMIQGTGSGVGKSLIVAGLCRIFSDLGIRAAPFKSQNMALNSFITREGAEIGRAQALQAEAARLAPSVDMNPILLKASGEHSCHIVMNGKVYGDMQAQDYYAFKESAWKAVTAAYERLSARHDVIVIEGAGSPAEINLMEDEIVNMRVARHAQAPVLLVGDIDKGGVFASFYGTIGLLRNRHADADNIKAFIINKFRGDRAILDPALGMIAERTGIPVVGVIPFRGTLGLHEEDGIPMELLGSAVSGPASSRDRLKVVVLKLRSISNFTDFDPFLFEPDVDLSFSLRDRDIEAADLIMLPGSKNTVHDLAFLREHGIDKTLDRAVKAGTPLIGICGGYQMLGQTIHDPYCVESNCVETKGLGYLDIETLFEETKITSQVEAYPAGIRDLGLASGQGPLPGYEIHMGRTTGDIGLFNLKRLAVNSGSPVNSEGIPDGSAKGNVWGTYVHGLFDSDEFRRDLLNRVKQSRGLPSLDVSVRYADIRDQAMNDWADILRQHLDMAFIMGLIGRADNI
jgi:adenosylcobyric acid synthase